MSQFIQLSLGGDVREAFDLQRWIQHGARECQVQSTTSSPPLDGHKGVELTNELLIAVFNAPALLALARCIATYLFARPEVSIDLVQGDGSRLSVNAKNVSIDKIQDLSDRLSSALLTQPIRAQHA